MIVQELHNIQHRHGYLPAKELRALAGRSGTRLHRLQEVASFFPHFRLEPPDPIQVRICQDMSCQIRGACDLIKKFKKAADNFNGPKIDVEGVSCLGRCDRAPAAYVGATIEHSNSNGSGHVDHHEHVHYYMNVDQSRLADVVKKTAKAVQKHSPEILPKSESDIAWQPNQTDDWSIDVYKGKPDNECYMAIRQFIERQDLRRSDESWRVDESVLAEVEGALRGSLAELDSESQRILVSLFTANLLGMGGAGGRAYKKWFEVHQAKGDIKYVVCNGDESEPGTFKDREILLRSPHLVVEAVTLAGLLVGGNRGYIYIRHEFEEQIESVRAEIKRAERLGVCGDNIMGSERSFPVEVFVSPGGYICGEQTALIEAMEDKRAEPRNRPPELQTNGLWDCPTLLNNVETLAWVPAIVLRENGKWFADAGSVVKESFKGRRFFSISGDVAKPGAYEVPIGLTFGELVDEFAGGMKDGMTFKAAALSGPSGGFTPRKIPVEYLPARWTSSNLPEDASHFDLWNMQLDIPVSRSMGVMMGAGMVVFGDQTDMVQTALSATTFYRNESCGKCVPCRIGSQKLVELLTDISNRKFTIEEIYGSSSDEPNGMSGLVSDLSETMKLTAICGLGTVASNPVWTLLNYFRSDIELYAKTSNSKTSESKRSDT